MAKRNINGLQTFTGFSKFNNDIAINISWGKVQFFDIWSQVSDFIDQVIWNFSFVLKVEVLELISEDVDQIFLGDDVIGKFLNEMGGTLRCLIYSPSLGGL